MESLVVYSKKGARRSERPSGEACHVGLGPRLIETISSSADGALNDASQLIYFCRDHPNRLKPNAMQKCYICGQSLREIENEGIRLTGCLNCNSGRLVTAKNG